MENGIKIPNAAISHATIYQNLENSIVIPLEIFGMLDTGETMQTVLSGHG